MNRPFAFALLCASSLFVHLAAQAGEIRLYTDDNFKGRVVVLRDTTDDLSRVNFNDAASSIKVESGTWDVCTHSDFKGDCKTLAPGEYRSLPGMNDQISSVRELGGSSGSGGRRAALELFADGGQRGASAGVNADRDDLVDIGFNDRASSARIEYGSWQLCSDSNYRGSCRVFGPGSHDDLGGLNGRVSSARMVDPREENRPQNKEGLVVLYADTVTPSMRAAITETERRRKKQDDYNKAHGIVPQTIRKSVRKVLEISHSAEEEKTTAHRKLTDAEREAKRAARVKKKAPQRGQAADEDGSA